MSLGVGVEMQMPTVRNRRVHNTVLVTCDPTRFSAAFGAIRKNDKACVGAVVVDTSEFVGPITLIRILPYFLCFESSIIISFVYHLQYPSSCTNPEPPLTQVPSHSVV